MEYFKRWLGEILIDIGNRLINSSVNSYVRYARKQSPKNRYNW